MGDLCVVAGGVKSDPLEKWKPSMGMKGHTRGEMRDIINSPIPLYLQ